MGKSQGCVTAALITLLNLKSQLFSLKKSGEIEFFEVFPEIFSYFLVASEEAELKTDIYKSLTRKSTHFSLLDALIQKM